MPLTPEPPAGAGSPGPPVVPPLPPVEDLTREDLARFVRDLADTLKPLHADAAGLRSEMTQYRNLYEGTERRTRRAIVVGSCFALVLAIGVVTAFVVSTGNRQIIDAIRGCTEPTGRCYEDNQARSNERLGQFVTLVCLAIPAETRPMPPCPPPRAR